MHDFTSPAFRTYLQKLRRIRGIFNPERIRPAGQASGPSSELVAHWNLETVYEERSVSIQLNSHCVDSNERYQNRTLHRVLGTRHRRFTVVKVPWLPRYPPPGEAVVCNHGFDTNLVVLCRTGPPNFPPTRQSPRVIDDNTRSDRIVRSDLGGNDRHPPNKPRCGLELTSRDVRIGPRCVWEIATVALEEVRSGQ